LEVIWWEGVGGGRRGWRGRGGVRIVVKSLFCERGKRRFRYGRRTRGSKK